MIRYALCTNTLVTCYLLILLLLMDYWNNGILNKELINVLLCFSYSPPRHLSDAAVIEFVSKLHWVCNFVFVCVHSIPYITSSTLEALEFGNGWIISPTPYSVCNYASILFVQGVAGDVKLYSCFFRLFQIYAQRVRLSFILGQCFNKYSWYQRLNWFWQWDIKTLSHFLHGSTIYSLGWSPGGYMHISLQMGYHCHYQYEICLVPCKKNILSLHQL